MPSGGQSVGGSSYPQQKRRRIQVMDNRKERSMKAALFAMVLLLSGALAAQTPSRPQQNLHIPEGMKQYFFGFLVKGEKWAQTPPHEELHHLMQQHLAYIRRSEERRVGKEWKSRWATRSAKKKRSKSVSDRKPIKQR